jgi:DNA repair protein RecN (Recombination protein N)
MLRLLRVENLAVLAEVEIPFAAGLNVLTGETGAGKSLALAALALALGARAEGGLVREGEEAARVDLLLDVPEGAEVAGLAAGEHVLTREIGRQGRSLARLDGRPTTRERLREIGEAVVELVGQGEGFRLRSPREQVRLLDAFGRHLDRVAEVEALSDRVRHLEGELALLGGDPRQRARTLERLRFEAEEIEGARLESGEEERLLAELAVVERREALREALAAARDALAGDPGPAAYDLVAKAVEAVRRAGGDLPLVADWLAQGEALLAGLADQARAARRLWEQVEAGGETREALTARLRLIADLKRKYGASVDEVLAYGAWARGEAERLAAVDDERARIEAELERTRAHLEAARLELDRRRAEAAARLADAIEAEFRALELPAAKLVWSPDLGAFLFAANPGERPLPLGDVASGGELHRLVLALALVAPGDAATYVFDEVDTGVGGEAAKAVADRLHRLAAQRQVIAVTHQAMVAARADHHVHLVKVTAGGRTHVRAEVLADGEGRLRELARMLAGREDQAALEHAAALLRGDR